jgi:hypothetical protein
MSYADRWQSVVSDPGWWFWSGVRRLSVAREMGTDADAEIAALHAEIERLEREGSEMAAGQCVVQGGLVGDDGGTPYCTLRVEIAALRAEQGGESDG